RAQIVPGRLDARTRGEPEREPAVGLVGRLVARETRVPIDPEQGARRPSVGHDVRADPGELRPDRRDEGQERVAHLGQVALLVRVEPLAVVVSPQLLEKAKELTGHVGHAHYTERCRPPSTWMRSPVM